MIPAAPMVFTGDCLEIMRLIPTGSVSAIVTDPPYGLGFMGKAWDDLPPGLPWAQECLRVLKPGGHLLAFGGTRTWHRLACAVEDAGFEMRDSIAWLYGSGFPKSHDVSKAIDKLDAAVERLARAHEFQAWLRQHLTPQQVNTATCTGMGHHFTTHPTQPSVATADLFDLLRPHLPEVPEHIEALVRQRTVESKNYAARAVVGRSDNGIAGGTGRHAGEEGAYGFGAEFDLTTAHSPEAQQWQGWGTALKPAFEPVVVARKPLVGTVAANVLQWGCGAINIDGTRIGPNSSSEAGSGSSTGAAGCPVHGLPGMRPADAEGPSSSGSSETARDVQPRVPLSDDVSSAESSLQRGPVAGQTEWLRSPSNSAHVGRGQVAAGQPGSSGSLGAPDGASAQAGSPAPPDGDGAPPKRGQGRQPQRESAPDGLGRAFSGAPADRAGTDGAQGGERTLAGCTCSVRVEGRWPANVVLDESSAAELDEQSGVTRSSSGSGVVRKGRSGGIMGKEGALRDGRPEGHDDTGGASRFFYVAKAPKSERPTFTEHKCVCGHGRPEHDGIDPGLCKMPECWCPGFALDRSSATTTAHPTVKPLALMRWLVRLVTPPGGLVLDPFAGSGTTVEACILEGFPVLAIEREADYLPLIQARIDRNTPTPKDPA